MRGIVLTPQLLYSFVCATLCIAGFAMIGGKRSRLGYLLSGLGSAGWLLSSRDFFFAVQSLFFLWISAMGFGKSQ